MGKKKFGHWKVKYVSSSSENLRYDSFYGKGICFASKTSRPAIGPTYPPIQCEPGFFFP